MVNRTITIPLDPQTAQAYDAASEEEKRKLQALLSLWLRELATGESLPLQRVLDEVGQKAIARREGPPVSHLTRSAPGTKGNPIDSA